MASPPTCSDPDHTVPQPLVARAHLAKRTQRRVACGRDVVRLVRAPPQVLTEGSNALTKRNALGTGLTKVDRDISERVMDNVLVITRTNTGCGLQGGPLGKMWPSVGEPAQGVSPRRRSPLRRKPDARDGAEVPWGPVGTPDAV